jgi:AcrR family transcriptional regulator
MNTRDRILDAAAVLFAERGYAGTSTRDIAEMVGIQQPGLYRHFASKPDILRSLFDLVLAGPMDLAERLRATPEPAVVRLYCWVLESTEHLAAHPHALASIYQVPLRGMDEVAEQLAVVERLNELTEDLILAAIADGDIRSVSPSVAARLLSSLSESVVSEPTISPIDVAEFVFNALLADRRRLPSIAGAADELQSRLAVRAEPVKDA